MSFVKFDPFATQDQQRPRGKAPNPPKVIVPDLDDAPALRPGWSVAEWRQHFDLRASYREHDCGEQPAHAVEKAFTDCVRVWLARHPPDAEAGVGCLHCGNYADQSDAVPMVCRGGRRRHVHTECAEAFNLRRIAEAVKALGNLGIRDPLEGGAR